MKKLKLLAASALLGTSLFGAQHWNAKSLIAIEGAYSKANVDYQLAAGGNEITTKTNAPAIGLKIGAEGDEFRIFVGIRDYLIQDFTYAYGGGVEFQYLLRFTDFLNLFVGVEGGGMQMKFNDGDFGAPSPSQVRIISTPYFGGDVGFNLDIGESFGIELGARFLQMNALNTQSNGSTVAIDSMVNGYGSLIYKF